MVFNKVDVKCPACGKNDTEVKGFVTKSVIEDGKDKLVDYNHYWCSGCHHSWEEERTDKNQHKEYFKREK